MNILKAKSTHNNINMMSQTFINYFIPEIITVTTIKNDIRSATKCNENLS